MIIYVANSYIKIECDGDIIIGNTQLHHKIATEIIENSEKVDYTEHHWGRIYYLQGTILDQSKQEKK